jgi:hypothetical protein
MIYRGRVKNGVVVFENQPPLADGTAVRIQPVVANAEANDLTGERSIWSKLQDLAGAAESLPADLAERHDEYKKRKQPSE